MKKETPRSLKAQGRSGGRFEDSGARHGMPTTGRDLGKAQSKRAKRGLRHNDPRVASSARPSGTGSRHQMGQKRRLGSGQQDRGGHRDSPAIWRGLSSYAFAQALSNQQNFSQLLQTLRFLEGRPRK
jgi:hypothetical protein